MWVKRAGGLPAARIGTVVATPTVSMTLGAQAPLLSLALSEIESAWRGHIDA